MMAESKEDSALRKVPMEILVLGLSRTGTSSMQRALQDLGYPNVYHTRTIIEERPADGTIWVDFLERKFKTKTTISQQEWDQLLGDFNAAADVPCVIFWRELLAAYPHAKVILTIRDSTEAWYKSYSNTIGHFTSHYTSFVGRMIRSFPVSWILGFKQTPFDRMIVQQIRYTPRGKYKEEGRNWYDSHNAAVKQAVPAENLLVYNVKEGWAPLCRFLGKPIPHEPFPVVFTTDEYHQLIYGLLGKQNKQIFRRLAGLGIIGAAAYIGVRSIFRR